MRKGVVLLLLMAAIVASAQDDTAADDQKKPLFGNKKEGQSQGDNQLDLDLNMLGRGEMRYGGFTEGVEENHAQFLMGRTRLSLTYKRPHIEAKVTAQHSGIWGQKGNGSFNLHEAWAKLYTKSGLFAKVGRQVLSYDDERIIGANDWAMASNTHDVIKLGYEGHGHKVHGIFGFNQNTENISGGTYYADGAQPYKLMHTLWYHYDIPKTPLGISLLFMNIGMQGGQKDGQGSYEPRNIYQQLVGGYVLYKPGKLTAEASYYHQLGRNENNAKINAWMASVKAQYQISPKWGAVAGYDYLSGDDYFVVRKNGGLGLVQHKVFKFFNPVYGSHHKFYGLMDFFYVQAFSDTFSPGLQNLYAGASYSPIKGLNLRASYHYLAMATKLEGLAKTLGHDIDVEASYQILKDASVAVGFSYMAGTDTMEKLKRAEGNDDLKWAWFTLMVSPRIISKKW
ncbi:MAG: alginate export family protein [Bacteroidaceae bacterium]|nr:alginate export family protein [Bacteroidaceae bacterium]